jgi:transposase-like protein
MWNERLEEQAARMRRRNAAIEETVPPRAFVSSYPRPALSQESRQRQRAGLDAARARQASQARDRQADAIELPATVIPVPDHIDPQALPPRRALGRPKGMKQMAQDLYPLCPRCNGENVIRRGVPNGFQQYRCKDCKRNFAGRGVRHPEPVTVKLICYRCGAEGRNMGPSPHSGRTGYCPSCRKRFIQGGRNELAKYHLLLEQRVNDLKLPDDVRAEALQMAYRDVIEGAGYCWTVGLRTKEAWRNARGEYRQFGSDDRTYRRVAEGQRAYDYGD